MNLRHLLLFIFNLVVITSVSNASENNWFSEASISPDGKSILFTFQGDIYRTDIKGGEATAITVNAAWDGHPIWSPDGKNIAFASNRHGNLDVYVMPASGGTAKRLTFHSSNDIPTDFTKNGKSITFSSARKDSADSSLYPTRRLPELYNVRIDGGTPTMVLTSSAQEARWSPDGNQLAYLRKKAPESDLRKHDTSAFARDIWVFNAKKNQHEKITDFSGADHNPVWSNRNVLFYTSEEGNGAFNIWRLNLKDREKKQITFFKQHPVRSLSIAKNYMMAFIHHGDVYTVEAGEKPQKLKIKVGTDRHGREEQIINVSDKIAGFSISPSGKEIAFVARGEVFVTSTDFKTTKRITDTPYQERTVDFHPDGRKIVYAAEQNDKWLLKEATLKSDNEKYFFSATDIEEKILHEAKTESFQPLYSPDGKKVAFLSGRDTLKVLNIESGKVTEVLGKEYNYSYTDGDINFDWSPDSQWLTVDFAARKRLFVKNIAIVHAEGKEEPRDISLSGYNNAGPQWHKGGDAIFWSSAKYGQRDHGSWGREYDVLATFLNRDAFERFTLSKEEYALKKELEKDLKKEEKKSETKDKENKEDKKKSEEEDKAADLVDIEWDRLEKQTVRLTGHSSDLAGAVLNKTADKLYYLAKFEAGYDLWLHNIRERKTILLAKLGQGQSGLQLSADDKELFVLSNGRLLKFALNGDSASQKPVALDARMRLDADAERAYFFEHIWRQTKNKFYRPDMHGIDWDQIKKDYAAKLPSLGNNKDFARMMEEMLGELNASHTGAYYRHQQQNTDQTAALGLFFDLTKNNGPLKVLEVMEGGPFFVKESQVKAGVSLTAIDGVELNKKTNLYRLLNNKINQRTRLTFKDAKGKSFDEVIKPISLGAENRLLYNRWVDKRRAHVAKLSDGRLGYVHIPAMNDASFRSTYEDLLGRHFDTEAVVIDTRWNAGGWLHNDLAKLFSGREYFKMDTRGRAWKGDPLDQWTKPSIVVMNEGNYSNGHGFPYVYKTLGLGELVGMPVPGTMTAVWWEVLHSGDVRFGIPQVGMQDIEGNYLENVQLEPDHMVRLDPDQAATGEDPQIEKAVKVLLDKLSTE